MRLVLTGRNVEITPALRQLIDRKLSKLERVLNDSVVSAQIVLTLEKYRHITEITMHARGDHMLHGVGDHDGWPLSLRQATDKIAQQAHKLKDKWDTRKRRARGARALPVPPAPPPQRTAGSAPSRTRRIVRATRSAVKPMSVEDAALKIEGGQETFVVFRNASTDAINILYRRKDGNFGLIEPDA